MDILLTLTNLIFIGIVVYLKLSNNNYINEIRDKQVLEDKCKVLLDENTLQKIKLAELQVMLDNEKRFGLNTKELFLSLQNDLLARFKAVSSDVMSKNNNDFLNLATSTLDSKEKNISTIVNSLKETIVKFDNKINDVENSHNIIGKTLSEQLRALLDSERLLGEKTSELTSALRSPNIRGHWGEMQLKRLLEMSGMLSYVDFVEQGEVLGEDDNILKPDVIVNLPGGKHVIIDVKTPLLDYYRALDEKDQDKRDKILKDFIKRIRDHINNLSKKRYQDYVNYSPDFVIMFMPSESLFSLALMQEPTIIEIAALKNITIATPSTLLSMLNIVAAIWKNDKISNNLEYIITLGKEICTNLMIVESNFNSIGKNLQNSLAIYHDSMAILEKKIFVETKQFLRYTGENKLYEDKKMPGKREKLIA